MADIATLSIKVDTSDLGRATKKVEGLVKDLKAISNVKVSVTSAKGITAIAEAVRDFASINNVNLRTKVSGIEGIGRALSRMPATLPSSRNLNRMAEALGHMSTIGPGNLNAVGQATIVLANGLKQLSGVGSLRPKTLLSAAEALAKIGRLKSDKLKAAAKAMRSLGSASAAMSSISSRGLRPLATALKELGRVNGQKLAAVAKSMRGIGGAMSAMANVTGRGLTPLANGLARLAAVDASRLNTLATAMQRIGNASARITSGANSIRQLANNTLSLQKRLERMEKSARRAQQTLRDTGRTAGGTSGRLRGLSNVLRNLTTTLVGTFGIVRLVRSATEAIASFELGMVDIQKTARLTEGDTTKLAKSFIELGTSAIASTAELQKVGIVAGQLGIEDPEQILKFADSITRLADGAPTLRGALDETALSITQLLQVTGGSVDDIDALASTLLLLGNTSKATEEQILKTGIEVAAASAAFNVSAQEALGLATALAQVRVPPERGRTAIITTMKNISDALDEGGQRAKNFAAITGQSLGQLRTQFETSGGRSFASLVEGLKRVQNSGGNVTAVLRTLGLNSIRTQTSILALLEGADELSIKMDAATAEFDRNSESLQENSELMTVSERAADTLTKSLERARSLIRAVFTGVTGEDSTLGRVLRGAVELASDLLRSVLGLEAGFGKYRERVKDAAKAVAELFGLNPDNFTGFFDNEAAYKKTLEAIKVGVVGIGVALTAMAAKGAIAAVTFTGGIALIPIAIGAAVAALYAMRDETVTVFGEQAKVGDIVANSITNIAAFFVALGKTAYAQFRFVGEVFAGFGDAAYDAFSTIIDAGEELFRILFGNVSLAETDWDNFMKLVVTTASAAFGATKELIVGLFRPFRVFADLLANTGRMREALASGDIGGFLSAQGAVLSLIPEVQELTNQTIGGLVRSAMEAGVKAGNDAAKAFQDGLDQDGKGLPQAVVKALLVGGGLGDEVSRAFDKIGNPFGTEFFLKEFEGAKAGIDPVLNSMAESVDKVREGFKKLGDAAKLGFDAQNAEAFAEALSKVQTAVERIQDRGIELQANLASLRSPANDLENAMAAVDAKAAKAAATFLREFGPALDDAGKAAARGLFEANAEFEKLILQQEEANRRADTFASTITSGLADAITGAKDFEDAIKGVIESLSREVIDLGLEPLRNQLRSTLAPMFGAPGEDAVAGAQDKFLSSGEGLAKSLRTQAVQIQASVVNVQGPPEVFGPPEAPTPDPSFVGPLESEAELASMTDAIAESTPQLAGNTAAFASLEVATQTAAAALRSLATAKTAAGVFGQTEGLFGPPEESAKGNAFWGGGKVHAFAKGGAFGGGLRGRFGDMLTNGPVGFPLGIAGEAGPEAIVPISRMGGSFTMGVAGGGSVPLTRDGSGNLVADMSGLSSRGTRKFATGAVLAGGAARMSPGMSSSGYTGGNVTQNITIQANDVESFRRSERQIQGSLRRGVSSATRNITR
jgi:TP901 family phage tail tape measure protein